MSIGAGGMNMASMMGGGMPGMGGMAGAGKQQNQVMVQAVSAELNAAKSTAGVHGFMDKVNELIAQVTAGLPSGTQGAGAGLAGMGGMAGAVGGLGAGFGTGAGMGANPMAAMGGLNKGFGGLV